MRKTDQWALINKLNKYTTYVTSSTIISILYVRKLRFAELFVQGHTISQHLTLGILILFSLPEKGRSHRKVIGL